jgi:hypothetical protein
LKARPNAQDEDPAAAVDVFKPPKNLFQLRSQYLTAPGKGSTPGSIATVLQDIANLVPAALEATGAFRLTPTVVDS